MKQKKELKKAIKAFNKNFGITISKDSINSTKGKNNLKRFFRYASVLSQPNINQDELSNLSVSFLPDSLNQRLRNQARNLQASIPLVAGVLNHLPAEVYGEKGFILNISTKDKELNTRIENLWFNYENECDIYGNFAFEDFEELVLISLFRDGEAFVQFHKSEHGLKLEFVDADLIDNTSDNGDEIIQGVEYEINSLTPKYYYKLVFNAQRVIKIPATNLIHIKKPLLARSTRGLSMLAPAVLDILQKQNLKRADVNRSRLDSELTGYFTDDGGGFLDDSSFDFSEDENAGKDEIKAEIKERAEVGKMQYLPSGIRAEFAPTRNPTNTQFLMQSTDAEVAKSLGLSYASYTGDLSNVNYSSIRVGNIEQRRLFKRLSRFIKRRFHYVVFKQWLECELLKGEISLSEFDAVVNNFDFNTTGWEYIDPKKEIDAQVAAINVGLKTRTEILAERGVEVDEFLKHIEADKKITKALSELNTPALLVDKKDKKEQE